MAKPNKQELWKAMTEPSERDCETCKHRDPEWGGCGKLTGGYGCTMAGKSDWEWDGETK